MDFFQATRTGLQQPDQPDIRCAGWGAEADVCGTVLRMIPGFHLSSMAFTCVSRQPVQTITGQGLGLPMHGKSEAVPRRKCQQSHAIVDCFSH